MTHDLQRIVHELRVPLQIRVDETTVDEVIQRGELAAEERRAAERGHEKAERARRHAMEELERAAGDQRRSPG